MRLFLVCILLLVVCATAMGQQANYVPRFDAFGSFSYLATPKMNLYQRGFNGQLGMNVNRWLAIGTDFSIFKGHSSLTPEELVPEQRARLAPYLGLLPAGTKLSVPYNASTYTFTAGPQVNIRKLRAMTFFVRPAIGILHEKVTGKPNTPLADAVVTGLVGPSKAKSDTTIFWGAGGGMDLNVSRNMAFRVGVDVVHVKLFKELLEGGRNSVRLSIGPTYRWGSNVQ